MGYRVVLFVILCLAVVEEFRLVTRHRPMASTADAKHRTVKIDKS